MQKTNWLSTISQINAKRYVVPHGWDTKEAVAESLQCDPSRVADLMKPGIDSGEIERQVFPVWDASRRMAVQTVCYRVAGTKKPNPDAVAPSSTMEFRIAECIRRNPGWSNARVAKSIRGTKVSDIAAVRQNIQ